MGQNMKILVLNKEEIKRVITMPEAIAAAREALESYAAGEKDIPLRSSIAVDQWQGQALFMPGYAKESDALGLKVVSVYPENPAKGLPGVPSTMLLLDSQTGQVNALMDGTSLTQLRTGAMAGAASAALSRPESSVFALIGSGGQARSQLEAVLAVRPIKHVFLCSRNPEHARAFARSLPGYPGATIEVMESIEEAIAQADIITTVTTAKEPVFSANAVKPGTHINAMGSYTPAMSELPEQLLERAAKLYVDTMDAFTESGDFQKPFRKGSFDADRLTGEIGRLFAGEIPGRENPEEITLFESTGNAILDLVTAKKIYDKAISLGIGTWIEL